MQSREPNRPNSSRTAVLSATNTLDAHSLLVNLTVPCISAEPLAALIDSGASDNFIDSALIQASTTSLELLPRPNR